MPENAQKGSAHPFFMLATVVGVFALFVISHVKVTTNYSDSFQSVKGISTSQEQGVTQQENADVVSVKQIKGRILNFFYVEGELNSVIDAQTGALKSQIQPLWLKVLSPLIK